MTITLLIIMKYLYPVTFIPMLAVCSVFAARACVGDAEGVLTSARGTDLAPFLPPPPLDAVAYGIVHYMYHHV